MLGGFLVQNLNKEQTLIVDNKSISVVQGDLTEMECDALVNAANNRLWMGGGVAGALKRKGGKIIEDEAIKKGPIPIGEAAITTAGKLRAKYEIKIKPTGYNISDDFITIWIPEHYTR